jgi:hypothetical protein
MLLEVNSSPSLSVEHNLTQIESSELSSFNLSEEPIRSIVDEVCS